ncbi:family 10 glycosylhydrolase [Histomonas meleagridis]|uniref:family 10 glycosylhydrolase n=1 Tax=Histomonas meleagridis TaxID=135588 RepID=UPI00355A6194|nr:family 10 glycosylhydrolase [Histomonas meleagridis]KAH0806958.1 family 10 glycosylhydrolase [Histomonas meleagridis]
MFFALLSLAFSASDPLLHPKREFRGAWIQCVNGNLMGMTTEQTQAKLISQLDSLQEAGINAIIFQVRAECDALYNSEYEPWSRFLTGKQGVAPNPLWDPLQFMVDECHKRCMELHAWINPYRAQTAGTKELAENHPINVKPELFLTYAGQVYFDPGYPESRQHILQIVEDIVTRYDIDAIHMDDYFYPYPSSGEEFGDTASFAAYSRGFTNKGDWRRDNVNLLIKEMHELVRSLKPWVKFGVSPFGIYRNKASDPNGSDTRGLQNYDDLYADILLWVNEGWVDYNIPQVYWQIGYSAADYDVLVRWWAKYSSERPLYIGQDVVRTIQYKDPAKPDQNQIEAKYTLQRQFATIQGSCQWYAQAVVENQGGYRDALINTYHKYPALVPTMPFIYDKEPGKVTSLATAVDGDNHILVWNAPEAETEMDKAIMYVIYRFDSEDSVDLNDPANIVGITRDTYYILPYPVEEKKGFCSVIGKFHCIEKVGLATQNLIEFIGCEVKSARLKEEMIGSLNVVLTQPSTPAFPLSHDNSNGDLIIKQNDILDSPKGTKYKVISLLGRGQFGQVLKVQEIVPHSSGTQPPANYAVKISKSHHRYRQQAQREVHIMMQIQSQITEAEKECIVQLYDWFIYHDHVCMVIELLSFDLYEVIKRRDYNGLPLQLVQVVAKKMLVALIALQRIGLIHCDLKPENILLGDIYSFSVKMIDFGSTMPSNQKSQFYIQSRYYRAPEVLLGMDYSFPIDMWSLGCVLFELFTALPLFPGQNEFQMIELITTMLGNVPERVLQHSTKRNMFFNENGTLKTEQQYFNDNGLGSMPQTEFNYKYFIIPNLKNVILEYGKKTTEEVKRRERPKRLMFYDFLEKILRIDPDERLKPNEALQHPFINVDLSSG